MNRVLLVSAIGVFLASASAASADTCFYEEKSEIVTAYAIQDAPKNIELITMAKLRTVAMAQVAKRQPLSFNKSKAMPSATLMCFRNDGTPSILQRLETAVDKGDVVVRVGGY